MSLQCYRPDRHELTLRRRLFAVVLVLANSASFAAPQQQLVESIEVRVANIDVVVRDKAGNPVTGLTKDDFELYEDGTKQPLTISTRSAATPT